MKTVLYRKIKNDWKFSEFEEFFDFFRTWSQTICCWTKTEFWKSQILVWPDFLGLRIEFILIKWWPDGTGRLNYFWARVSMEPESTYGRPDVFWGNYCKGFALIFVFHSFFVVKKPDLELFGDKERMEGEGGTTRRARGRVWNWREFGGGGREVRRRGRAGGSPIAGIFQYFFFVSASVVPRRIRFGPIEYNFRSARNPKNFWLAGIFFFFEKFFSSLKFFCFLFQNINCLPDFIEFKPCQGHKLTEIFSAATPDLIELLNACLKFDPLRRCTASEALRLPYFSNKPYPAPCAQLPRQKKSMSLGGKPGVKRRRDEILDGEEPLSKISRNLKFWKKIVGFL